MSDTPRADAYLASAAGDARALEIIRELERELAEEKAEVLRIHHEKVDHYEARLKAERELAAASPYAVRMQENLRDIEWAASGYCPACHGWDGNDGGCCAHRHAPSGCWLQDALAKNPQGHNPVCSPRDNGPSGGIGHAPVPADP